MIKRLSKEVQGKLRSGVAVCSLQQCVEELLLNSIDAGATCVCVRMDMDAFKVQVIDNGSGMDLQDMEHVGNRYFTSKCASLEDLDNLTFYGFRGEAVASIVSLATLVEISSRTKLSVKTHVKVFKDGKGLDVFEADATRPSSGTSVVICNFFHNMPVRRKRMDPVLEGERIRQRVEAISLMHPSVSFTLKNDCTGAMVVQLPKARDTYNRFVQIHGLGRAQRLGEISYTHGQFEVSGYLGREGHYNNSLQFVYVNDRLVLKTQIHKLLNVLLRKLRSSTKKNISPDVQSSTRSPKHTRGHDLNGMYVLDIKCPYSEYDICLEPSKTLIEFKDWDGVLLCIEEAVKLFLSRENLVSELSPEDLEDAAPKLFGTTGTEQEVRDNDDQGNQATFAESPLECNIRRTVASVLVHRKREEASVLEDNIGLTCGEIESKVEVAEGRLGAESIPLRELERKQDHSCIDKEHASKSEEPRREGMHYDLVTLTDGSEHLSEDNITNIDMSNSHDTREESQSIGCMPSSVSGAQQTEQPEINKDRLMNKTTIVTQEIQPNSSSFTRVLHQCRNTDGPGQTSVDHKKISLSDPYVHDILQARDQGQYSRPRFHQHVSALKGMENSFPSKRKFSVIEGSNHSQVSNDLPSGLTSKIPKVTLRQRLSLSKEPGSLDVFRRIYGKLTELKPSSEEANCRGLLSHTRVPQTDNFPLNPQSAQVSQKEVQESDITETQEKQSDLQSPLSLSMFTRLNPISDRKRQSRASLAAKLSHLKQQQKTNVKQSALTHNSGTMSVKNVSFMIADDNIQDGNNNDQVCGMASKAECVTSCSLSLDQFRRIYGKSTELKQSSKETNYSSSPPHPRVPQTDNLPLNPQSNPDNQEEEQESDITETQEQPSALKSPLSLSMFTRLKPITDQNRDCGASLASKLKNTSVPQSTFTHHSGSTPVNDVGFTNADDNIQDGNNSEQACDKASKSECVTSCCVSPQLAEEEELSAWGDWLHHYDDSVGKTVYVNKVTGLSRYEDPSAEETQVACTSDITNMAVSVISKTGMEYRCYPFQMDLVFPFLPKSRAERVISTGPDNREDDAQTVNSLSSMYSKWNNPVFVRPPMVAVDISSEQADGLAVKIHNILFPYRFSKAMVHSMKVINQVDQKFLACLIDTRDQVPSTNSEREGNLLVLVDQHAAHERVRLENLVADSYEEDPEAPGEKRLCSSNILPPLEISLTEEELRLLRSFQSRLRRLGLEVGFTENGGPQVLVGKVPLCFIEKESNELKRGRPSVIKSIVEEYLQEQIEFLRSTGRVRGTLPLTVLKVLASLACHGAIKFNHSLSQDECCSLIGSLSSCQLPFQCAHGRPSIVPLVDILHLDNDQKELPKPNLLKLRRMCRAWELYGMKEKM